MDQFGRGRFRKLHWRYSVHAVPRIFCKTPAASAFPGPQDQCFWRLVQALLRPALQKTVKKITYCAQFYLKEREDVILEPLTLFLCLSSRKWKKTARGDRISGLEILAGNLGVENKSPLKCIKQVKGIPASTLKPHLILAWQITSFQPQANLNSTHQIPAVNKC